ncbi:ketoacyl-ACP synthase III family protein [Rhizomonospora bruguierae]|uniref:ketoacyl-ACP synthase III family protein n=1 Tax=Rhizomonospora bruguierae TaxID=1581705 RepID=UPI001BD048AA|nr:ketoacyl-ACP synthase III family protein [Micromonospora sp. NBRC 107566]
MADGRCDPEFRETHGYLSVSVLEDQRGVLDPAVEAGRAALSRAGVPAGEVRLVVHASSETHGPDDLPPASYIQGRTVGTTALAVELRQACNGALAALELAAAYLSTAPAPASALVTTSDRNPPGTDRYRAGQGELAGDAATAVVLSRGAGVARLLSTAVVGDGRYLGTVAADPGEYPSRAAFLAEQRRRLRPMLRAMSTHERTSVETALADAGLVSADISRWVFANVGQFLVDQEFRKRFGIAESMTTWEWGRTVGHLGAGNQLAGLTHLVETGAVRVGDRVALCGNGVGFSYGCAILEISTEPAWDGTANDRSRNAREFDTGASR